jgi:cathepsin B
MMKFVVFFTILASVVSLREDIHASDESTPALRDEIIDYVNNAKTTWKASRNKKFQNASVAHVKRMLGTIMPGDDRYREPEREKVLFSTKSEDIPESFDVRENWANCAGITGHVRDQSDCGSCWAFGSTEAFNDRHCIATGDATTLLSPEDTNACCSGPVCSFSMGCNGGQPSGAWNWFTKVGVSSGGDYEDNGKGNSCKPYSMQSCVHHAEVPEGEVDCSTLPSYSTPKCTDTCYEDAYGTPYSKDKLKATDHYSVKGVENIQKEIMEKGTVSVAMTVYEDFETYTSGIYQHTTGHSLGGHAIKMIGWGVENGTPYWICVNSWNVWWGEEGTFRILRGSNECGIEGSVVAGSV